MKRVISLGIMLIGIHTLHAADEGFTVIPSLEDTLESAGKTGLLNPECLAEWKQANQVESPG